MKYALVFALVACAFVAQANAKSIPSTENIDRGAIANAMRAKLEAAKKKLDEMLDKASGKLKETIVQIQKKAEELIDQLKDKASEVVDKAIVKAEKVIAKVEKIEDQLGSYFG